MAVRRSSNPKALARKRAAFVARVRRITEKVRSGKVLIEDVVEELRAFVEEEAARIEDERRPLSAGELAAERARALRETEERARNEP